MFGWLTSLLTRRSVAAPATDADGPAPLAGVRGCLAAQAALERHDLAAASAHLDEAARLTPHHPLITELRGRLALLAGRAADAADHLDRRTDNLRRQMLSLIARSRAGDLAGVELDLTDLARQPDCPAELRVLLASIQLDRGHIDDARRTLHQNLDQGGDALTSQMLLLLDLEEELPVSARQAAGYLAHGFARHGSTGQFLDSLELDATPMAPLELVDQLAAELLRKPQVIPTLVAAYRLEPRAERIELLRRALYRIVDEVEQPICIIESLAELAIIAGEADDARRWAQRGLRVDPYSARLALLLDDLAGDSEADVRTLEALRRVSAAHPNYSDVRRALILRYQRSGLAELAARHAQNWLEQTPDHPMAQDTARELAA
jgi:lipopolysaccharide biosynthesis regulator YciM